MKRTWCAEDIFFELVHAPGFTSINREPGEDRGGMFPDEVVISRQSVPAEDVLVLKDPIHHLPKKTDVKHRLG